MNRRQIFLLCLILGMLGLAAFLKFFASTWDPSVVKEAYPSLAISFDPERAAQIIIGKGLEAVPVELVKNGDEWRVRSLWDARADVAKVKDLLTPLNGLKGDLRSSDGALLKDFSITDQEAVSIKIMDAGKTVLIDLRIGAKQPGQTGFFVRQSGKNDVYYVETAFDRILGLYLAFEEAKPLSDFWADLELFNLNPEQVTKIEVSRLVNGILSPAIGVQKVAPKEAASAADWKAIGSDDQLPIDPDKVIRFIATINSIRAQNVADPNGKDYGLEKPAWQLAVTEGDHEIVLWAGSKNAQDNTYPVKIANDPQVFRLTAYYFEDLDIKGGYFLKETPKTEASPKAP